MYRFTYEEIMSMDNYTFLLEMSHNIVPTSIKKEDYIF